MEMEEIKTKENLGKIIMDYREKNSLLYLELIKKGLEIEIKNLKVGDYIINNIAIERKSVSDFFSSMINKRLLKQLEELQQYEKRLLVIEGIDENELYSSRENLSIKNTEINNPFDFSIGEKNKKNSEIHPNAIRGFLLSIMLTHKVPILLTKDAEDTSKFMELIARKKPKENSLNVTKKSLNKKEKMQFIIEGFPGIGPKNAKKLLNHFKTIKNIINASEEEIKSVIGKKSEIFSIAKESYIN